MVAFHDEFHPVFIQNFDEFPVVVTGINPDNDLSEINFQRFHLFQAAPEKFHRSILAVLTANPQFIGEHIALAPEIGEDWRVSINLMIGSGNPLFLAAGIQQCGNVDIQRNQFVFSDFYRSKRFDLAQKIAHSIIQQRLPGIELRD